MDRRLNAMLLVGIAKNVKYTPAIIRNIKTWPTYFLYYLGFKKGGGKFVFRDGTTIVDNEGTASGTIAVVFIRKQYGTVVGKPTIVEIGANIGTFAVFAAKSDKTARLYSYEPVKANYDVLLRNIAANGLQGRVTAFNLGVASRTEQRDFYLTSSPEHTLIKSAAAGHSVRVNCVSLSDILRANKLSKVDLLKINCEGAEFEILYSTPKECFELIDEIRMEYHDQSAAGHNLIDLQAYLATLGYVTTHLYRHRDDEGFLWVKKAR